MADNNTSARKEIYVSLAGEINLETYKRLLNAVGDPLFIASENVHLVIQSGGGMISDGIAAYNLLSGLPQNLITYNMGDVASIAVLLYLAGKTRRAAKHSSFMIHKAVGGLPAGTPGAHFQSAIDLLNINNDRIEAIIKAKVNLTQSQWDIHSQRDLHIDANGALGCGLATEIAEWRIPAGTKLFTL